MIGPVSSTGRAMMASLEQAIQKGMPPDQAIQYVKGMATQGVAPLADLYAMMNQFQRLKQPQAQAPQTPPTIRDQLNMLDQQQRMQQQMPQQPMAQGLGAMNAGRMENPRFAGGGIVAFAAGDKVTDFTKLSIEDLDRLIESDNVEIARGAFQERLNRSKYTSPSDLLGKYTSAVRSGIGELSGGPFIKFDTTRKFPSYMYDEAGNVRQGEVTGGIAGTKYFSSSRGPTAVPAAAVAQSAVPDQVTTPYSSPADAGAAFDRSLASAQRGVRQDTVPAARTTQGAAPARGTSDPFLRLVEEERKRKFQEIPDTFSDEERKRIDKALSGLTAEKKDAVRMALAQAGFGMAAAASRAGRQRTTGLGALAEGAIGGLQQYNATQKELRQNERELNKEMASLRRYQDEVARGERAARRSFEENKATRIGDLTARSEQLKQNQAELAQRMQIATMESGVRSAEQRSTQDYRTQSLKIEGLKAQLSSIDKVIEDNAYPTTNEEKQRLAALQADRMRIVNAINNAAQVGGGSAASGVAPITRSGW